MDTTTTNTTNDVPQCSNSCNRSKGIHKQQQQDVEALVASMKDLVNKLNDIDTHSGSEEKDVEDKNFERHQVRLDGIEVYAVIAALNLASSIACLDTYGERSSPSSNQTLFEMIFDACFTISNALGILAGIHATLIFSMVTMYGRTAIGLDRDRAFHTFLAATGEQRLKGFHSFTLSLYCFLVQCIFMIVNRMALGSRSKFTVLSMIGYLVYLIGVETHFVMKMGSKVFENDGSQHHRHRPQSFRDYPRNSLTRNNASVVLDPLSEVDESESEYFH